MTDPTPTKTTAATMLAYLRQLLDLNAAGDASPADVVQRLHEMFDQGVIDPAAEAQPYPRDFDELRGTGLLWLINATVFHPRGFALGLVIDDDGVVLGWQLLGDGSEPIVFEDNAANASLMRAAARTLAPAVDR